MITGRVPQAVPELAQTLPRLGNEVPIMQRRVRQGRHGRVIQFTTRRWGVEVVIMQCRVRQGRQVRVIPFTVRRWAVGTWLRFLTQHNPAYANVEIYMGRIPASGEVKGLHVIAMDRIPSSVVSDESRETDDENSEDHDYEEVDWACRYRIKDARDILSF